MWGRAEDISDRHQPCGRDWSAGRGAYLGTRGRHQVADYCFITTKAHLHLAKLPALFKEPSAQTIGAHQAPPRSREMPIGSGFCGADSWRWIWGIGRWEPG